MAFTLVSCSLFKGEDKGKDKDKEKGSFEVVNSPLMTEGFKIASEGYGDDVVACFSCHGDKGAGVAGPEGYPRLAGQREDYIYKQLEDFKHNHRLTADGMMYNETRALKDSQIRALAYYFSHVPETKIQAIGPKDQAQVIRGKLISQFGLFKQGVPACIKCHGPQGEGMPPFFARLAGQHKDYILTQLKLFKSHKRKNDRDGLMGAVVEKLTLADIEAVALYYSQVRINTLSDKIEPISEEEYRLIPDFKSIPKNEFGDFVIKGFKIYNETPKYAAQYMGEDNKLRCVNCHLQGGLRANSAPLWGAYGLYPKYRKKNHKVNTFANRMQGCFKYSLDGKAPPADSDILKALSAYAFWSAKGKPVGVKIKGAGYPKLSRAKLAPSKKRGLKVYKAYCLHCHGADGQGRLSQSGEMVFPPLWGKRSFNWGAGMHRINTAAAFIGANMPYGHSEILTNQQTWDVAKYVTSFERGEDPRYNGDRDQTRKKFHQHMCSY